MQMQTDIGQATRGKVSLNKVYLMDGLLCIDVIGNQTGDSVKVMGDEIIELINQLRDEGKPVLILDNVTKIGKADGDVVRNVAILTKLLDYDRAAMIGRSRMMRISINAILRAVGRNNTKFFASIKKAEAWLNELK